MRKVLLTVGGLVLVAALSGCGKKHRDLTPEQEMNAIMEANSPFADAEIRMDDAMTRAVGVDVGDSWVRKMIEHHRGGAAIAREVLTMKPDAHVAQMARAAISQDASEIADLQSLVVQGTPNSASAALYQPTMDKMHQAMMGASGHSLWQTYHLKMLEHHKGAVAMDDVALANGVTGALLARIRKARADHEHEAAMVEAMLRNEAALDPAKSAAGSEPKG